MRFITPSLALTSLVFARAVATDPRIMADAPLVGSPGSAAAVQGWYMQSSSRASHDMTSLSKPGADMSPWYRVGSRGTVMAGLIENDVYNETHLFFSDNLKTIKQEQFAVPWLYREEVIFNVRPGQYYFLETNGITSKADLYLNGVLLASKDSLRGAYGGRKFDITEHLKSGKNAILIRAYPTNYLADFALGFVDWNPYPPDNGTGVWREVMISQTGPVSLLKPRVTTDYVGKPTNRVTATINVVLKNSGTEAVEGTLEACVKEVHGGTNVNVTVSYTLKANETKKITLEAPIRNPKIWWPKLWGPQPLYTLDVSAYVGATRELSDRAAQRTFGIRHVTSALNAHNATAFTVNGQYFHVRGAGYSSDMFLRLDETKLTRQFEYMLDMGMNTVRLEGKQEHPVLYDLADRMGLMVIAGWECCDKWEGWKYNDEAEGVKWVDIDYVTAGEQMHHEAYMMQGHASMLAFFVGSDFWPDERASKIYVDTLRELDWDVPIISSAAARGFPSNLGPSGMKMDGPYDWVPPNYWYGDQLGAAFGFGSELGSGVGTPEVSSLKRFLTASDLNDLWTAPNKGLYHMSTSVSQFYDRSIYNKALYARFGAPTSLEDYLLKAQAMDYEATRSQYEAYSAKKNSQLPATGLIYWMLNNAWPSLHWNLFDYHLKAAGSYYGAKVGSRPEHVVFEYGSAKGNIWLINHTLDKRGARSVDIDLISKDGRKILSKKVAATTQPNHSQLIGSVPEATAIKKEVVFLRLVLRDAIGTSLSRNVYALSPTVDKLDWNNSTWYYTPVTSFADYNSLATLRQANLIAEATVPPKHTAADGRMAADIVLENQATVPAYFIRLELQDVKGADLTPAFWTDNYLTLWPGEKITIGVSWPATAGSHGSGSVKISGWNVGTVRSVPLTW